MTSRPVPIAGDDSAAYWHSARDGVLALAHCRACGRATHPPVPVCPRCGTTDPGWEFRPVVGRGVLRSWTVVRQSFLPGFADEVPVVLADVAMDGHDDLRLIGRLLDGPDADLHLGAAVTAAFERLDDGTAIPAFELVGP